MSEPNKEDEKSVTMPFLQSAFETAKQVIVDPGFASIETQNARLDICVACPHLIKPQYKCKICGCRMRLKVKAKGISCPDDPPRWGPEEGTPTLSWKIK